MKCTITDMNNSEVYSKIVSANGKGFAAFYWGNSLLSMGATNLPTDGQKTANMNATSQAIDLIIKDIKRNKNEILIALK